MRRIAVLTTGRQDWGILRSTCLRLRDDKRFDLRLAVGGMHCAAAFGRTEQGILDDGFLPAERLDWVRPDASATELAGQALAMIGEALVRQKPEAVLLVGDRFETAAAALAATLERVPIVHLHGGEQTAGAIDNALRHAITKLSHLHLVSHAEHAARVVAMGEDSAAVHVVGGPGLDNLWRDDLPSRADLERELGRQLQPPLVVVTVHPETLADDGARSARAVASAMDAVSATYVVTLPNNDPGHRETSDVIRRAAERNGAMVVEALGERRFWGLLRTADAMLGNSSSALIEASAVQLPAVNVGDRQAGRLRGENVVDVVDDPGAVVDALREALDPVTRRGLIGTTSPYGDGRSAARIVDILVDWTPPVPPRKPAVMTPRSSTLA